MWILFKDQSDLNWCLKSVLSIKSCSNVPAIHLAIPEGAQTSSIKS